MNPVTRSARLKRDISADDSFGTTGIFMADNRWTAVSLERPWRGNIHDLSCVPPGIWLFSWAWSPDHGMNLYRSDLITDRLGIEFHPANIMDQLKGCIALGDEIVTFPADTKLSETITLAKGQKGITDSRKTIALMEAQFRNSKGEQESFYLTIE